MPIILKTLQLNNIHINIGIINIDRVISSHINKRNAALSASSGESILHGLNSHDLMIVYFPII